MISHKEIAAFMGALGWELDPADESDYGTLEDLLRLWTHGYKVGVLVEKAIWEASHE